MKTLIIQLEKYDDIVSARDKMNWAKGGRILLVWPEGASVLNRRLDLALLQRHSQALGAQLALVSNDREVGYHAPRLGIPVYKTLRKAQNENWRLPRRFRNAQSSLPIAQALLANEMALPRGLTDRPIAAVQDDSPALRLAFFVLGVLALLSIAALLLPSAVIEIAPQTQVQDVLIDVTATVQIAAPNLSGAVPAQWVEILVEGRDNLPASGSMQVAESAASGEIQFTNLTDQPVEIPIGVIVLTTGSNPVRFAVSRGGKVDPRPGSALSLPAVAMNPGEAGNLPAHSLIALEGLIGAQVSADNLEPTRGGTSRLIPAPTSSDRRALHQRLSEALESSALKELLERLNPEDVVIPTSLERVEELESSFQPREGLPSDDVSLHMRAKYRALVVPGDTLSALVADVFDANVPPGATALPDSQRIEHLNSPVEIPEGFRWQLHAHRLVVRRVEQREVIQAVLGRSRRLAEQQLVSSIPMDEPPIITVRPGWWPRLPYLPFRVSVRYANSGR